MTHHNVTLALMLSSALWTVPAAAQAPAADPPAANAAAQQTPTTPDESAAPAPANQAAPAPAVPTDTSAAPPAVPADTGAAAPAAAPTANVETSPAQSASDSASPAAGQTAQGATLNGSIAGSVSAAQLASLQGKDVTGAKGQKIGTIIASDENAQTVQLHAANGKAMSLPSALLHMEGDNVTAPTVSTADVTAMAAVQSGDSKLAAESSRPAYRLNHKSAVSRASAKAPAHTEKPVKESPSNTSSPGTSSPGLKY